MAQVKDIILDENNEYDLLISNGDFSVSESDPQHQILIINTTLGSWKQFPLMGVGIINFLNSSGQTEYLKRQMTVMLKSDGFQVNSIKINPNEVADFTIDAERI